MTFSESISTCFHKYVTFEGRASRSEFWWFFLFGLILGCIPAVNALAEVVLFLPGVAVCCRRLHDRGKTGWLQALPLGMILLGGFSAAVFGMSVFLGLTIVLAFFSSIWLLVECAREGYTGSNRYGPPPLRTTVICCPYCHAQCREGERFCSSCGMRIDQKNN